MKKLVSIFFVLMFTCSYANAFTLNGSGMNYAGRTRYIPRNTVYGNRFQRPHPNYIYSPAQARYYGYRTNGIYGAGYNNTYYYNRYRR
jgi:hypothetical protein